MQVVPVGNLFPSCHFSVIVIWSILTRFGSSVIIDEAQCIKNKSTKAAQGACHLQALTRFCMSGTPMMNNVGELYSLIHFLRIKPYNESERFNRVSFRNSNAA